MVNFKEIYHFSRFQRGSNIFQGGPTFSRWGVQLLIPYRNPYNYITCDFPGGVRTPCPPSGSALENMQVGDLVKFDLANCAMFR